MHDFDSYLLYEIKKRNVYSCRIKVTLTENVKESVLKAAAEKAFSRFSYYSRKAVVNEDGAYILEPCDLPITVSPDDHIVKLGTEETNSLLFSITYEKDTIFFNFAHNFCGGCGSMRWIKTTLWQYFTDLGYQIDSTGILTPDTQITPEECAEPDIDALPEDLPLGNFDFAKDSFTLRQDYMEFYTNPDCKALYYPITIPKKDLMKYSRANDGSPNSIISAVLFKMLARTFPDQTKISGKISCNYRADVGCPETYRDIVRQLFIPYDGSMKEWPMEKLSTITRSRMYTQMQPEVSWMEARKVRDFRQAIDEQPDLMSKVDYAVDNSPTIHGIPSTFVISYVGKVGWGGLAPYIKGVFSLTFGHVMLEINATEDDFCISFQTVRKDRKYLDEFLNILKEEGISYTVGEVDERRLPEIILPPFPQ